MDQLFVVPTFVAQISLFLIATRIENQNIYELTGRYTYYGTRTKQKTKTKNGNKKSYPTRDSNMSDPSAIK